MRTNAWCLITEMSLRQLVALLTDVPPGPLTGDIIDKVMNQVEGSWTDFSGSSDSKMDSGKIGRGMGAENVTWEPPILSFVILRHGAAMLGSNRAEKQGWRLNLDTKTANHAPVGYRQLLPRAANLDVKAIVRNVFEAVAQGQNSDSELVTKGLVRWDSNDQVSITQSSIIPDDGPKKTIEGRRRRFREQLTHAMRVAWEPVQVRPRLKFKKKPAAPQ